MTSITLTAAAATQIRKQIAKQGSGIGLRVGIKPVGCSGYAYTYALAEDVRIDEQRIEAFGATLLVATDHLASLEGASLDFVTEGLKQTFQFDNPNVGITCGCGESFSLKPGSGKGAIP
ncbi:iron-sulfur cluster assembly accessory protein [Rhodoferax sp.]|uniref:HesB/IscA family protein n=1 Tax=Rhodoferax sp. TaxID=50421 RepID=UPI00273691D1|nr:iron-sulfur cluster assembly accessory protein [Rhodoferax sp.]MDP3191109.1 iron-sulfur cluster assembly accessory protein [Rhodoferax sp.]MDP3338193.1 iron-sulfur cluster assembly accessory protein [Rhodoferax sp.]